MRLSSEFAAVVALVVLCAVFQYINPLFLSAANIQTMLRGSAYVGLVAVGMSLAMISGLVDISVGSLTGLVSCFCAWAIIKAGASPLLALAAGLAIGVAACALNAAVILKLKINPFIATISAMYIYRGLATWISGGSTVYPLPDWMAEIGNARPFDLSWAALLFFAAVVAGEAALHTVWGLQLRATGSDRIVARDTEVNVDMANYTAFAVLGFLAALSGVLITLRVGGGSNTAGLGVEFRAILACALGGVSIFGYTGSVVGAALGVLLAQVISTGLVSVGMNASFQDVVLGAILIAVIGLDAYKQNIKIPIFEKE